MAAMCKMAVAHFQNIQVQQEPAEFVWVEPPLPNISAVDLLYPNNSWKSCIRSRHEEEYGLKAPILCKADSIIATELGEELVNDKDSNDYWWQVEIANEGKELYIMEELKRLEDEEHGPFVLAPNDPSYDTADMCIRSWEEDKNWGIPPEVQRRMVREDDVKDAVDREMIKDMARFECEANLNILRSTPPEDRYAPDEHHIVSTDYSGWTRKKFSRGDGNSKLLYSVRYQGERKTDIRSMYVSERIRCTAVVIRKPSNGLGYGLLVCDYGLVHVANKYLPMIPDIGMRVTVTISPTDVGEEKPFPLSAVFIHKNY